MSTGISSIESSSSSSSPIHPTELPAEAGATDKVVVPAPTQQASGKKSAVLLVTSFLIILLTTIVTIFYIFYYLAAEFRPFNLTQWELICILLHVAYVPSGYQFLEALGIKRVKTKEPDQPPTEAEASLIPGFKETTVPPPKRTAKTVTKSIVQSFLRWIIIIGLMYPVGRVGDFFGASITAGLINKFTMISNSSVLVTVMPSHVSPTGFGFNFDCHCQCESVPLSKTGIAIESLLCSLDKVAPIAEVPDYFRILILVVVHAVIFILKTVFAGFSLWRARKNARKPVADEENQYVPIIQEPKDVEETPQEEQTTPVHALIALR